jgi:hypothetical protein
MMLEELAKEMPALDDIYETKISELLKKITNSELAYQAEHLSRRRLIISLFDKAILALNNSSLNNKPLNNNALSNSDLNIQKSDNITIMERFLHNILYPMGSSSADGKFDCHNLWLVDEKLTNYSFLSSEVNLDATTQGRNDFLFFDNTIAMTDSANDGTVLDTICLFVFKRPMRDDFTLSDNPIDQLYSYFQKIKDGKVYDKHNRPIRINYSTKAYLYAVSDITRSLKSIILRYAGIPTPDIKGYFILNPSLSATVQILSYDKLINDSKRRNDFHLNKMNMSKVFGRDAS